MQMNADESRNWLTAVQLLRAITAPIVAIALAAPCYGQVDVLTSHNDISRSGANTRETILTPANVGAATFSKLFTLSVDGQVYSQPLVASKLKMAGGSTHNVLFVCTQHDSVYAFDADSNTGANSTPLWQTSFLDPAHGITSASSNDLGCGDIYPEVGICSTPVIDRSKNTIYIVAKTEQNGKFFINLHALNLSNGHERTGSPVLVKASSSGRGAGSIPGGTVPFQAQYQMNRPGLLETNGLIYVGFASHCDIGPYHGWVLAYDPSTLALKATYNTTPNSGLGGIWMGGNGLAADSSGYVYAISGNGSFDADSTAAGDYGDSFLKLRTDKFGIHVQDWFSPYNQQYLDDVDGDMGSGGGIILPDSAGSAKHPHLMLGTGKEGRILIVDRDKMGHYNPAADTQIVQTISGAVGGCWSSPAYFAGSLYYAGVGDTLKQFTLTNAKMSTTAISQSPTGFGYPGATPSISANGTTAGIVWVIEVGGVAVLHAYDATDVATELYNSSMNAADGLDAPVKFAVPTVANGKVYVGTSDSVAVFGNS